MLAAGTVDGRDGFTVLVAGAIALEGLGSGAFIWSFDCDDGAGLVGNVLVEWPGVVGVFGVAGDFGALEIGFVDAEILLVVIGAGFAAPLAGVDFSVLFEEGVLILPSVLPFKVSPNPPLLFKADPPTTPVPLLGPPEGTFGFLSSTDVALPEFPFEIDSAGAASRVPRLPFM